MSPSSRVARATLTSLAGLVLAGAGLVALPSTAHAAAVDDGQLNAIRQVSDFGPATCNATNASSSDVVPFTSNGATVTNVESGVATLTDAGDASDVTTVTQNVVTRARATEVAGSLKSVDIDLSATIAINANQGLGTDCDASVTSAVQAPFTTVVAKSQWVTGELVLPLGAQSQVVLARTSPASPSFSETFFLTGNSRGKASFEVLVPPGTYQVLTLLVSNVTGPQAPGDPSSFAIDGEIVLTFDDPGSAVAKASGTGTKYAQLGDAVSCAASQLTGKFLKAAGTKEKPKLKKAVFKVNGTKTVVKKIKKGKAIRLGGVPRDEEVTVAATFKLVGGGKETLTRTYRPCS